MQLYGFNSPVVYGDIYGDIYGGYNYTIQYNTQKTMNILLAYLFACSFYLT